jgi:hypothetical protein
MVFEQQGPADHGSGGGVGGGGGGCRKGMSALVEFFVDHGMGPGVIDRMIKSVMRPARTTDRHEEP